MTPPPPAFSASNPTTDDGAFTIVVNAEPRHVWDAETGASLLTVLRENIGLLGTKDACEQGECGSCTVLMDGATVCACLVLAADAVGSEIVTVEGLGPDDLTPLQSAFLETGAVQCGFCTPGLIVVLHDLLERHPGADRLTVQEAISGNLCRCTGYGRILEAVRLVQERAGA